MPPEMWQPGQRHKSADECDPPSAAQPSARADANRRMFDSIARRYDILNTVLSLGLDRLWRRAAVDALLRPGAAAAMCESVASGLDGPAGGPGLASARREAAYLDVGCGTGELALAVARRVPDGRVVGIDASRAMLEAGVAKVARAGLSGRVRLRQGDACALPFGASCFDGVLSAFCLRNFADLPAALAEMRRVLRPGAPAAILELSVPAGLAARLAWKAHARVMLPVVGGMLSRGEAYRYLVRSIEAFAPPLAVVDLLRAAGFAAAVARPLSGGAVTLYTARLGK